MAGARKSAKYIFIGNLFSKIITFLGSIILARILFPEDYGYLLIAMIVTGFAQTLSNMGFENYYLQESIKDKYHEEKILDVTFKLRLFINSTMFFIQFFGSYWVADYYSQPIVGELLRIFAFNYIITGVAVVNIYILRKKLNYKTETIANVSRDIIGVITKIVLASMGWGALSFAYGAVAGNIVRSVIVLLIQRFKFSLYNWDSYEFKRIFYFGKHSLIGGIGNYFSDYIDKIFITKYFTPSESGYYFFANSQSKALYNYTVYPQASLFLSYIANYKKKPEYLMSVLSRISYMIGILSLPIMLFLLFYANPIFLFVFGEKWQNSVILFQMFLIFNYLRVLVFPIIGVLTGFGYPQIVSKLSIARLIVLAMALTIAIKLTSSIYVYALIYMMVVLLFDWMKAGLGLKVMDHTMINFLKGMHFISLLIIANSYLILLYLSAIFFNDIYIQMLFSFLALSMLSLLIYLFFQKKEITSSVQLFLGSNHKIIRYLNKR